MLVSRCVYVKVRALGTRACVVVGSLGEDVAQGVKRVIGEQGAQHSLREGEMWRATDNMRARRIIGS